MLHAFLKITLLIVSIIDVLNKYEYIALLVLSLKRHVTLHGVRSKRTKIITRQTWRIPSRQTKKDFLQLTEIYAENGRCTGYDTGSEIGHRGSSADDGSDQS